MGILDDIMQELDPEVILRRTQHEHDDARGRYVVTSPTVRNHREFVGEVIAYINFHHAFVFGIPMYDDLALSRAREFLENNLKGGWEEAVMFGLSGENGGMRYICDSICEGFKREAESAYVSYILDTRLDPLSFGQIVELMREFKAKLSNYALPSFRALPAEAMAADYKSVIYQYISSLKQFSNLRLFSQKVS